MALDCCGLKKELKYGKVSKEGKGDPMRQI
jgi:hypothetical protein